MFPALPLPWLIPHLRPGADSDPRLEATFQVIADAETALEVALPALAIKQEVDAAGTVVTDFGGHRLRSQFVTFRGLPADTRLDAELRASATGKRLDGATIRTWPTAIGGSDMPFRLFLGSCFSTRSNVAGGNDVRGLVRVLRNAAMVPHLKVLCGDQVYLDIPVSENLPTEPGAMQKFAADKYLQNWGAAAPASSRFGDLLRAGTSAFVCDDHEFWNNYPNTAVYAPRLYRVGGGVERSEAFAAAAKKSLRFFQCIPPSFRAFELGDQQAPITLLLLDGRYARNEQVAHAPEDLKRVTEHLRSATGPVLLVLSQPLFDGAHRGGLRRLWAERVTDLGLADFDDYRALVDAIASCRYDVCVLTGDIHGGRICAARGREQTVWELVSSPLSLVQQPTKAFGGDIPKNRYPDLDGPRVRYADLDATLQPVGANHGVLLELYRLGVGYSINAQYFQSDSGQLLATRRIVLNSGTGR